MITRVINYVRVSSTKQADEGISLDAQQARAVSYANLYNLTIVETIVDSAESAKDLNRPGLKRALAMLGHSADGLLIVKLDRLTRSVRDLMFLVDKYFTKYRLISVNETLDTSTSTGRMMLQLLTVFSEFEREQIRERTKAVMAYKRQRNEAVGRNAPYGWTKSGKLLLPNEAERAMMAEIRANYASGMSISSIARSYLARSGVPLSRKCVREIITKGDVT